MKRWHSQRICGLVLFLTSLGICIESLRISIGTLVNPGPGFIALCSGILTAGLSAGLIICPHKFEQNGTDQETRFNVRSRKVLYVLGALFAYGFFFETIGFLVLTFLLLFFFLVFIERQKWWTVILISVFTSLGFFVLFILLLKVDLPAGILIFK